MRRSNVRTAVRKSSIKSIGGTLYLTAMKNGVYTLVAVLMGVMLVGLLPGQISNLATPGFEPTVLQGSKEAPPGDNITITGTGSYHSRYNSSIGNETITSSANSADTATSTPTTKADDIEGTVVGFDGEYDPYADLMYYGMMVAGLFVALGFYFVSKRMLG